MNVIDKFERYGRKIYNGQDVLKNHILKKYPIHLTDDTNDHSIVDQYDADYVWIVDKNIKTLNTFPWFFKPTEVAVHKFPYIYKSSTRIRSWDAVKLVPTKANTDKVVEHKHICGIYDFYNGKELFDIFFIGDKSTVVWDNLIKRFPNTTHVKSYNEAATLSTTNMFWLVPDDVEISAWFRFSYQPDDWSHDFSHMFGNGSLESKDGIVLFPKNYKPTDNELKYRYYANKKEMRVIASKPIEYEKFTFKNYKEYLDALKTSKTDLFWHIPDDVIIKDNFKFNIYFNHQNQYDRSINHVYLNNETYDGIVLFSKKSPITEKEFNTRFYINKKEWDIVASVPKPFDLFNVETYEDYKLALKNTTTEMFWLSSANLKHNKDLVDNFYISHHELQLRKQTHAFKHKVDNETTYNGMFLCSKNTLLNKQEVEYRFPITRIEYDIVVSGPTTYDTFVVDNYDEYVYALENTTTEMFWATSRNISVDDFKFDLYFIHSNKYDRKQNHAFRHLVNDEVYYNGVFLFSKHKPVTQKEIEHRFVADRKEWNIVASGPCKYEKFYPNNYNEYLTALETSKTEMFWIIPEYVNVTDRFKFDTYFSHDQSFERNINHVYLNGKYYDGVVLCSKYAKFTEKEFDYKFIANKKEVPVIISTPKPFDVVFISYQEPNCEENYENLLTQVPYAKRIHGVKGIHQAHIAAAKLCNTDMFWIVDGDAEIVDDFEFNYQVAQWDKETVYVWRSQNPINDLVYGYGGIKLFPRDLTINMDIAKPDMTTSISNKFNAMSQISNITGFNTDPFNTWKSAFRECCKLSAKIIDRQKEDETNTRLHTWCSLGENKLYGKYAIAGAKSGALYGARNKDNIEALAKINDFDWLNNQFTQLNQSL